MDLRIHFLRAFDKDFGMSPLFFFHSPEIPLPEPNGCAARVIDFEKLNHEPQTLNPES